MEKFYYAVKVGRNKGIYNSWQECKAQIDGFSGAVYKKFKLKSEAENFILGSDSKSLLKDLAQGVFTQAANAYSMEKYQAYTDGSYMDGLYAWAFVIVYKDEVIHQDYGVGQDQNAAQTRNIAGELAAVMRACVWAKSKDLASIEIKHDLQGVATWAKGEWKRNNEVTVKYYEFMRKYVASGYVNFTHVKGHSGNKYNDMADNLAKKAIQEYLEQKV